jgi:hypothetical protein
MSWAMPKAAPTNYTETPKYYTKTNAAPTYHTTTCDYTEAPKYYTTTPPIMLLRLTTPKDPSSITLLKAALLMPRLMPPITAPQRRGIHYTTTDAALTSNLLHRGFKELSYLFVLLVILSPNSGILFLKENSNTLNIK